MEDEEETRRQRDFWGKDHNNIFRDEQRIGEYKDEERGGFLGIGNERHHVRYDENDRETGYSRRERRGDILGFGGEEVDGHYDKDDNPTGYSRTEERGGFLGLFTHREEIGYDNDGNEISSTQRQRRGGFLGIGEREVPVTTYRERPRSSSRAGSPSSSDDSSLEDGLIKLGIGIAILCFVVWLIFAVVIPLAIVNMALLALIAAATSDRRRHFFFVVAILGAAYVVLDYNNGGLTKGLAKTLPFLTGWTVAFVYVNVAAGLVAAFPLLRPIIVEHFPPEEGRSQMLHLYLGSGLALMGGVIVGIQAYADWRWQQSHPVVAAVPTIPDNRPRFAAPVTYLTSFDCDRATRWAERQICETPSLAASDRKQAQLYSAALARSSSTDVAALRQSQRDWLRARNACEEVNCVQNALAVRILILQNWRPSPPTVAAQPELQPPTKGTTDDLSDQTQRMDRREPGAATGRSPGGRESAEPPAATSEPCVWFNGHRVC